MVNFYSTIPTVKYFNEFLTNLEVEDFITDDNHLFTIILKRVLEDNFVNWANYTEKLLKYEIFSKETMKLLFVLIPEFLIMIKYQHMNNVTKYTDYIKSEYFIKMDENKLGPSNISNFINILGMFKCRNKSMYFNKKNEALKIYLSENVTSFNTEQHKQFTSMLVDVNEAMKILPAYVDATIEEMNLNDFICKPITEVPI